LPKRGEGFGKFIGQEGCEVEIVDNSWGFSLDCIQRQTGLSASRIMYRAKAKNIKIRDFRNGVGPKAMVLLSKFKVKKRGA